MLIGSIAGILAIIKKFTDSEKDIKVINLKENLILIEHGAKIFSVMVLKKNLLNARYVIKVINEKFEYYFWDYIDSQDLVDYYWQGQEVYEIFRPIESVINGLIRM